MKPIYKIIITLILLSSCILCVSAEKNLPEKPTFIWTEHYNGETYEVDGPTIIKIYDPETNLLNIIAYDQKASNVAVGITSISVDDLDVTNEQRDMIKQKYDINNYDYIYR